MRWTCIYSLSAYVVGTNQGACALGAGPLPSLLFPCLASRYLILKGYEAFGGQDGEPYDLGPAAFAATRYSRRTPQAPVVHSQQLTL